MTVAFSQYWALTKPRVIALIVFTAIIGMFLAVPAPGSGPGSRSARSPSMCGSAAGPAAITRP
jgi:protoheme IX farnesyltransferase